MSYGEINVINAYKNAWNYIEEVESSINPDIDSAWDKHLIQPFWGKIAEWAPDEMSYMKPKPIKDINTLKKQLKAFENVDFDSLLKSEFDRIYKALPKDDEDPITIAIYPLSDEDKVVKERQNGVIGCCVFGNILINVNPFGENFDKWVPYVLAHEYHHSVWGHNWYVLKGGLTGSFVENLLNEGQADAFAKHLYPDLTPSWLQGFGNEEEKAAWKKIAAGLYSVDANLQSKFMFGDKELGLPWCAGYYFGNQIINTFMQRYPETSFLELLEINPADIIKMSEYEI